VAGQSPGHSPLWPNECMTRYADPQRCPDCTSPIEYGALRCATCGLPLNGPVAQQLFVTLSRADELLTALRGTAPPAIAPARPVEPNGVTAEASPPVPATSVMSGASMPKILLTLGAGCLLVAALVFLAVTWSVMGVGGRTATLVGFTAVCGGITSVVAGRGLRGAVEALGLVTLGLITLDVVGADNAGWLGDPSVSTFTVVLGILMTSAATLGCILLRRTPSGAFTSGEIVAGLGVATAAAGLVSGGWGSDEGRLLVATLAALATVAAFDLLKLPVATVCSAIVGVTAWLTLGLAGFAKLVDDPSVEHIWGDFAAWPALAAAGVAGVFVAVLRMPLVARQSAASVATAIVTFVVVAPVVDESGTDLALAGVAVLTVAAAVLWLLPKPWSATAGLTLGAGALVSGGATLVLAGTAVSRLLEAAEDTGLFLDRLPGRDEVDPQPWLLLLAVPALCFAVAAVLRYVGGSVVWGRTLPFVGAATVVATTALYPLPVWLFVAAGLAFGVVFLLSGDLAYAAAGLAGGTVVSVHSDGLTAVALAVVLAAAAWLLMHDEREPVQVAAGIVGQLALAGSVWIWGDLFDRPVEWVAATGIVLVAAVALAVRKVGLEVGAALGVAALFLAGSFSAPADDAWTWVAVYLTLAGAAACVQSLLRDDRRELGWVGGLLLALATWVRLADIGVNEPEPYTLPSAVALIVVGLVHLRRNKQAPTMYALGPGLGLGLAPSLLWALAEPATPRSAILGLACLALVVAGAQLRWSAPLVYAGATGAVLVLRHAAPYIADSSVPRWVLIGFAGVLLVAMGVTWEQRVREARSLLGYVRGLR